jgi:hypothetical protein
VRQYTSGIKGYRLWDPIAKKVIISKDVSFNEPRILKEGKIAHAFSTHKGKSPIPNVVAAPCRVEASEAPRRVETSIEGEIDHYSFGDMPQREDPIDLEEILEQLEVEEQAITSKPLIRAPDDEDQPESFKRS